MLHGLSSVVLTDDGVERAAHGRDIGVPELMAAMTAEWPAKPPVRLFDQRGHLIGIAEQGTTPELLHPSVVLM